jgi:hypothetical protein
VSQKGYQDSASFSQPVVFTGLQVSVLVCNFEELKEVQQLAKHLLASKTPIHLLFNIAG